MLLHASNFALAPRIDSILPTLAPHLADHVDAETHGSAIELRTGVHQGVSQAIAELAELRSELRSELAGRGLRAAAAGMHPTTVWQETRISGGERYQLLYASLRELARREPTFALHVHVAVPDPEDAVRAMNGLRGASAATAGAVGELPLLAGKRDRTGLDANADVRGVPPCRAPTRLCGLRRLCRKASTCSCAAAPFPSRHSSGGTCAYSRAGEPSRCA